MGESGPSIDPRELGITNEAGDLPTMDSPTTVSPERLAEARNGGRPLTKVEEGLLRRQEADEAQRNANQ
jgi:hypothetical protein